MDGDSPVIKGVRGWLEKRGYPLEMRVARAFESSKFVVAQSHYYTRNNQPLRELDVVVWSLPKVPELGAHTIVDIVCVIECKSQPLTWVAFTKPWRSNGRRIPSHALLVSEFANKGLLAIEHSTTPPKLLGFGERAAHAVVTAVLDRTEKQDKRIEGRGDDGGELAYETLAKVVDGAFSFDEEVIRVDGRNRVFRIVLPIVVVTGPLVECWHGEEGEMCIAERERIATAVVQSDRFRDKRPVMTHVVRESELPAFIADIDAVAAFIVSNGAALARAGAG